jgi:hypothetical protein
MLSKFSLKINILEKKLNESIILMRQFIHIFLSPIFLKKCKNLRKQRDKTFYRNFFGKQSKNFGKTRNKRIINYQLFSESFFKTRRN